MKLSLSLFLLFIGTSAFCQDLMVLTPVEGADFDFGAGVQNKWKKRNQLLTDINNDKKNWDNLTAEENELFEQYDETFESIWDVMGSGCSWYCGAGEYQVTTSTELSSNGTISYSSDNLTDFSFETAWVEGVKGYGIGESINFSFAPIHPRITTIIFANGYVKSKKAWQDNSRVHELKMYVNGKPFAKIELKDIYAKQVIKLKKPLGNSNRENLRSQDENRNWTIKFEILSVYKGDKYDDTAISEIYFDGLDVHCLAKGTQITMGDRSVKSIEDLKTGDEVLSFNKESGDFEIAVVQELANQFHQGLVNIRFSNGSEITCTRDHPFVLDNLKWSSMAPSKTEKDYEINDVVQLQVGSRVKSQQNNLEVVEINEVGTSQKTYTIVGLDKNDTFIANGVVTGIERLRTRMF